MSTFITNTSLAGLRPLGSNGERAHSRMIALLTMHLSPAHAQLLADPVPVRDGSGVDWYVEEDGDPVLLSQLPQDEAAALQTTLERYLADIREKADTLDAESDAAGAAALRRILEFPGTDSVYALRTPEGLKPIIVAWGYQSHDAAEAQAFHVSAIGAKRAPPMSPPPPAAPVSATTPQPDPIPAAPFAAAPQAASAETVMMTDDRRHSWWIPLLAALAALLLAIVIFLLLIPACGVRTPFGTILYGLPSLRGCAVAATGDIDALTTRNRDLERELAALTGDYRTGRISCLVEEARRGPELEPRDENAGREAYERIDQRGDAQITLTWNSGDDLDLSLRCPNGSLIDYRNKQSCGGLLDVDRNAGNEVTRIPVENITFADGPQLSGPHPIAVTLFKRREGSGPIPFTLTIRDRDGVRERSGSVDDRRPVVTVDQLAN